jgi:hypothetical protein
VNPLVKHRDFGVPFFRRKGRGGKCKYKVLTSQVKEAETGIDFSRIKFDASIGVNFKDKIFRVPGSVTKRPGHNKGTPKEAPFFNQL